MEFLSIKDSVYYTSKSESTIKRLVKEIQSSSKNKAALSKKIKFEPLKTGHQKTFINKAFLDEYFNIGNYSTIQNDSSNDSSESLYNRIDLKIIDILKVELDEKNKQIERLNSQISELIERQKESNILLLDKSIKLLDTPKKRWWQKK
jgi:L-ribulose-5-phosphate 3-epimerase UlaE